MPESTRLGAIVAYLAGIFMVIALIGFMTTPPQAFTSTADRAQIVLQQGMTPNLVLGQLAAGIFTVFVLLTFVSLYRALSEPSVPSIILLTTGVIFASMIAFVTFVIHLGGEFALIQIYEGAPAAEQANLVNLERALLGVHDNTELLGDFFGFIALLSSGYVMGKSPTLLSAGYVIGKSPSFAKLLSWLSYAVALFTVLHVIFGVSLGFFSQISFIFLQLFNLVLIPWCFTLGRALSKTRQNSG